MDAMASQITSLTIVQPFIQVQIKENIKAPRYRHLCGEFTSEFPAQRASNAENVSIWWCHHAILYYACTFIYILRASIFYFSLLLQYNNHVPREIANSVSLCATYIIPFHPKSYKSNLTYKLEMKEIIIQTQVGIRTYGK